MAKMTKESSPFVKMIMVGESGAGKTGSLISLARAGYDIRLLDLDNGAATLQQLCLHENPDLLDNIDVISHVDKFKADPLKGLTISGRPTSYVNTMKTMNKWDDDTVPSEWGPDKILVLDSLTALGRASYHWAQGMNPTAKDGRQWYGTAHDSLRNFLQLVAGKEFKTNVIIMSHIQYISKDDEPLRAQINSIGQSLGPDIPKFFNNLVLAESKGIGTSVKRTITTVPTNLLSLKTTAPFKLEKSLPLDTGLATIFAALKPNNQ